MIKGNIRAVDRVDEIAAVDWGGRANAGGVRLGVRSVVKIPTDERRGRSSGASFGSIREIHLLHGLVVSDLYFKECEVFGFLLRNPAFVHNLSLRIYQFYTP